MQWCWYQLANPPLPPSTVVSPCLLQQLYNLINSCTQFPLETLIQLLKEAGVDLLDYASQVLLSSEG